MTYQFHDKKLIWLAWSSESFVARRSILQIHPRIDKARYHIIARFHWKKGILNFKDKLVTPKKENLRNLIMQEAHLPLYVAHPRGTKMRENLK